MEQVVGALQLQALQGGDEVSGGDNNSKLVAQEQLDDAWRQRARHELGEQEEQTKTQIGNLAASLPCDWPLPRWAFLEITSTCFTTSILREDKFLLKFLRATSFNQVFCHHYHISITPHYLQGG